MNGKHVPLRFQVRCSTCGDPLDSREPGIYVERIGWVKNRTEGGGNALSMAKDTGQYLCRFCHSTSNAGAKKWQQELFG